MTDLQRRTLKVTNLSHSVTKPLLKELFVQAGPVKNVVLKPDHAFVEFSDEESVGFALALMVGVHLFGRELRLESRVQTPDTFLYVDRLRIFHDRPELFFQ